MGIMLDTQQKHQSKELELLPSWFRQDLPNISKIKEMKSMFLFEENQEIKEQLFHPLSGHAKYLRYPPAFAGRLGQEQPQPVEIASASDILAR